MRKSPGFTLIELMISLTILSFIALAIYNNTSQSFLLRDNVERDGDFYNSVRVSLDVLGRDLVHMYSPQAAALPGDLGKAPTPQQTPGLGGFPQQPQQFGTSTNFWSEPINANGVRATRLQGDADKIRFIINSHMRLFRDTAECDFAKITYALEEDRDPPVGQPPGGKILIKHEDPDAFNEKDDGDTDVKYYLLPNMKSVVFKYYDSEKDTWYNTWDTLSMDHKGVFPAVIEVTVEVYKPDSNPEPGTERSTLKVTERFRPELSI